MFRQCRIARLAAQRRLLASVYQSHIHLTQIHQLDRQLLAVFPAPASKSAEDLNEMRRQWLLAFKENGITTLEQINAGMRVARKQEKPFMPSPGQFVAWCRSEQAVSAGLPDANELVDMVYQYCRTRGQYPDAESSPWPEHKVIQATLKHKAYYWMVTGLYTDMRANGLSDSELRLKHRMNCCVWFVD